MQISNKKKAIIVLALIWAIITFNLIKTTYAKYLTTLDSYTNISISYWNIYLNNKNITSQSNLNDVLEVVFPGNEYTQSNVVVPGATGYFDLNIDSSNATVPFSITVTSTLSPQSALTKDFVVSGYSINNGDITNLTDASTFTYNIGADVETTKITVYITWQDDGLDSAEDTSIGISGGDVLFNVDLSFEQIIE
jgi:hypothetical protein